MDPDTALQYVKQGATLLLIDVPQYTIIGIDTLVFSSGPNFKGIKMIPPGIHFVYYSSSNREGREFAPTVGFFVKANPSQVVVRKWDQNEEGLIRLSEEEEERYSNAVKRLEFDKQLGPYSLSHYGDWKNLSNYITEDTIVKLEPIGGEISVACESEMVGKFSRTAMEEALAEQLKNQELSIPENKSQKGGCYYTAIPRVVKQKGLCGEDLTRLNLDKTQLLESVIMKEYGGDEDALLAELQFAFIAFLMGQSLEAFLQWKYLLTLLFGCTESPLHSRSRLFTKFIKVVYYQLKIGFQRDQKDVAAMPDRVSSLLDESLLSSDSFLNYLCEDFFFVVLEAPVVDGDLLSWARKLKALLEESLGWKFRLNDEGDDINFDDDDEYAPVVEILDEDVYRG